MNRTMIILAIPAMCATISCNQPIDTSDLAGQEASLAAEGSMDMREQDGTLNNPRLATLDEQDAPPADPFDADPFIAREKIDRESTLDESNIAPGASTLVPGPESPTGDPMALPPVNTEDD
ncbi:MAG: hypothetical protein MK100_07345 [Phycisphaerales bacterium]|nr:hypothetical protein [Phycisphaerales bacterium]